MWGWVNWSRKRQSSSQRSPSRWRMTGLGWSRSPHASRTHATRAADGRAAIRGDLESAYREQWRVVCRPEEMSRKSKESMARRLQDIQFAGRRHKDATPPNALFA